MLEHTPQSRIRAANHAPVRAGRWVLYWMIATRRTGSSWALQHAAHRARELGVPLLVLEALRVDYPWASTRLHRWVWEGMVDNHASLAGRAGYHPYVEPRPGAGRGLLQALAADACLVVTDHFPTFFLPRMVASAASRLPVRLEVVDSNGVLPLAEVPRAFPTAAGFRRHVQRCARPHLVHRPLEDPLGAVDLPRCPPLAPELLQRWPAASLDDPSFLDALPLDREVAPVPARGGREAGLAALERFLDQGLEGYHTQRNHPDHHATSGLSPYLHFGHVGGQEVVSAILDREGWTPEHLGSKPTGGREGWWGLSPWAEAFLDQVLTWRELGFAFAHHRSDHASWESVPDWARATLLEHADDRREHLYTLSELERAQTHDPLWNAAQRELRATGRMHNYLRMLWGKKILQWSPTPQRAAEVMVHLNDRWALDGRDPNSYSGIFWVLGRHDRAWGPERPIFGKVRYMTSDSARRKLRLERYLERWSR